MASANEPVVAQTMDTVVHECSVCHFLSPLKTNVVRHVEQCPGATVVSRPCSCLVFPRGGIPSGLLGQTTGQTTTQTTTAERIGTNNNAHQINITNNVTVNIVPAGSAKDADAMHALLRDPHFLNVLSTTPAEDIPALFFRYSKGIDAPPERRNVRVDGNAVVETREGGAQVPVARAKFVKKAVGDAVDAVAHSLSDEPAVKEAKEDLLEPKFKMGKRAVSTFDVAKMYSTSSQEAYKLDTAGRACKQRLESAVNAELDSLATE